MNNEKRNLKGVIVLGRKLFTILLGYTEYRSI